MDEKINTAELQHHGVKGQKWGVRRTPAQLGHKPAGKKKKKKAKSPDVIDKAKAKIASVKKEHAKKQQAKAKAKAKAEADKAAAKEAEQKAKAAAEKEKADRKKSPSDMTDEELRKAIVRAQMEDQYKALRPDEEDKAKAAVKKVVDQAIVPAAMNSGKRFIENALNKAADKVLKDRVPEDELTKLTKEYNILETQRKISSLKNKGWEDDDLTWAERTAKMNWERSKREASGNTGGTTPDPKPRRTLKYKVKQKGEVRDDPEVVIGEVETDPFRPKKSTATKPPDIVIDMDTTALVGNSTYSSGSSYYRDTFSGSSTASKPPSAVSSLVSAGSSWLREQLIED